MGELMTLAERVEAAEGPSRELDGLLWCALHGKRFAEAFESYGRPDRTGVAYTEPPKRTRATVHVPAYTASLDAALALLESKLHGSHARLQGVGNAWFAEVNPTAAGTFGRWSANGCTGALALCAALLKALDQ